MSGIIENPSRGEADFQFWDPIDIIVKLLRCLL
jgi:hypothetical protein